MSTQELPGPAVSPDAPEPPAAPPVPGAYSGQQTSPVTTLRQLADDETQTVLGMLSHAGRPSAKTGEFWMVLLGPIVTFVVALVASAAVTRGFLSNTVAAQIVPPTIASVTAAAAAFAAKEYARVRTELKSKLVDFRATTPTP